MEPAPQHLSDPPLDVRGARGSSVIVQRVPPDRVEIFLEWQRGITAAAREFTGYRTTEVYSPAPGQKEWVVVIHFDNAKSLQDWLDSPKRAEWIAKLTDESRDYRMQVLPSGFGPWIAGLDGPHFPHWKMCLTVLLGLYPTVMVLNLLLSPHTERFGRAVAILIGSMASVVFLEFLGMPVVNRLVGPWLRANEQQDWQRSVVGLVAIVATLALLTVLFSLIAR